MNAQTQHGTSLIEMLVASALLAAGAAGAVRLHAHLRLDAELSRQRHEAVRLAQEDLEQLRAYATLPTTPGLRAWADVVDATATIDADHGFATTTRYERRRRIVDAGVPNARRAEVVLAWTDRAGRPQQLALDTVLVGAAPAAAGTLALDAGRSAVQRPLGRSPMIPRDAKDLGDGRSALKPVAGGTLGFVFDNDSGAVVERCTALPATRKPRDLSAADLAGCTARHGHGLGGTLHASATVPPSPGDSATAPLPFAVTVQVAGTPGEPPLCAVEIRKTVRLVRDGSLAVEAVPVDAAPAFAGVASWIDSGERHAAWHCVVTPPDGAPAWSGRVAVVPVGWTLGTGASDRRICRHAVDLDASGAVDLAIEFPAHYAGVSAPLPHQNLLVIAGDQPCPTASPVTMTGSGDDVFADLSTFDLQP